MISDDVHDLPRDPIPWWAELAVVAVGLAAFAASIWWGGW